MMPHSFKSFIPRASLWERLSGLFWRRPLRLVTEMVMVFSVCGCGSGSQGCFLNPDPDIDSVFCGPFLRSWARI